MSEALRPTAFALSGLSLVDIGPLRGSTSIGFRDPEGAPSNLFIIMGPNGAGKTTILDGIYAAMDLLQRRQHQSYGLEGLDQGGGVQLDAVVTLDDGARSRRFLLSIVAGEPGLLRRWTEEDLTKVEADRQIILQYGRRGPDSPVERLAQSDTEAAQFADAVLTHIGDAPRALFETAYGFPTVLYFPSDRGISRTSDSARAITPPTDLGYSPVHRFGPDGGKWAGSLDNLFVWFAWLDDRREELCREMVNDLVFRGGAKRLAAVDRQTLSVPVQVGERVHRLDQLSSGERQLLQLVVRVASHMTGATIVLIDEMEQHLHLVMRRRLMSIIKQWARDFPELSFVFTSHQTETLRLLGPKNPEPGLRKNGCLVKSMYKTPK